MSKKLSLFKITILLIVLCQTAQAQKINLSELHIMSSNKNWETSNKLLLSKGWEYYDSSVGDDEHYNIINWSFEKSYTDDKKANGWLYIYSYDGLPNKVMYRFRRKEYYTTIKNSLTVNGYKQDDEEILDQRVIAKYSNTNYILELTYSREEDDADSGIGSFTAYEITVYKKGGVYDPNNGKKQEIDENGNLAAEYFLKNGEVEGAIKYYNSNGTLRLVTFMKNGVENGTSTQYFYSETDSLGAAVGKLKGEFVNGTKNGKWVLSAIKDNVESNLSYKNYTNGLKNGPFTRVANDSLIVGNYKSDKLEGNYTIYQDLKKIVSGGLINPDTLQLNKITTGYYKDDQRTGNWKIFSLRNVLIEEGNYVDSLKGGKWKYYYDSYLDDKDKELDYSRKLYLEENYREGKKNGTAIRYSYFDEIEEPCKDDPTKICANKVFTIIKETSTYKDDVLEGPYELLDDNNELLFKGEYKEDKETGLWTINNISEIDFWTGETTEKGEFVFGKKQGKWERYNKENKIIESYNYKDNQLNGEHITYLDNYVRVKREFKLGELKNFTVLDTLGNTTKTYSLLNRKVNDFKCIFKNFIGNSIISKTYDVLLLEGEKISNTMFGKYFEELPDEQKILNGEYEKIIDGQIIEKGEYTNNNKSSVWNYYYYDQNIQLDIEYDLDGNASSEYYNDLKKEEPFSGEFIFIDDTSGIAEERKIKDGKRNGTTRYKDANNKTVKKESYKDGVLKE